MTAMLQFLKHPLKRELFFLVLFLGVFIFFFWFINDAGRVELYYSQGVFPFFAGIGQFVWHGIPFSVGDGFYVSLILLGLFFFAVILRCLFKKHYRAALVWSMRTLNVFLGLLAFFYLCWGTNYFRLSLAERMGYDMETKDTALLGQVAVWLVSCANEERASLDNADFLRSRKALFSEAEKLMANQAIGAGLYVFRPRVKETLSNSFANRITVSGYFNPFTQEAQVNGAVPAYVLPYTACHELAHQAGIGFEDEANFVAFLLAKGSDDPLFRYSAYYSSLFSVLNALYVRDTTAHRQILDSLSMDVREDMMAEMAYWKAFQGTINDLSASFYDSYLQVNNQPEGLARYNAMVALLLEWYERSYIPSSEMEGK